MSLQEPIQGTDIELQNVFLQPPTVSDTENDVLKYNNLTANPVIGVASWLGINSQSRLWLHCECTYANGRSGVIELAEAVPANSQIGTQAFSCELPLEELAKLADNTPITIILMVSTDGTRQEQSLSSARYSLMFQHPITLVNYSRWMTELGSNIEQLKIHDLILPEAHNAGVDQEGAGWPTDQWGACQDDTFDYQLNNGIRALDLRLYRDGSSFIFKHGSYDANRGLFECLDKVSAFAKANPGEIVILDFHEVFADGLEESVFSALQLRISQLCIPPSAQSLTIGQIRNRFPGKNVIIAWNSPYWFCWGKVHQTWTGEDLNGERALYNHILRTMADPPKNQLWSIFAAGYNTLGPIRFKPNAIHWDCFFNNVGSVRYRQPSKGNMINVDFFGGTGAVDRCITATRDRASKARLSVPTQLTTSDVTTNSIRLKWARPQDSETIVGYTLYANDQPFAKLLETEFVFTGLTEGRKYHLQIVPHFASGDGAAAEITAVTVDATKPSKPTDLRFTFIETHPQALLRWTASTDNVAVTHYKIYANNNLLDTVDAQINYYLVNVADFFTYRVRAVDAAGNFADSDSLTMTSDHSPPSKPTNLRASTITANSISLEWAASSDNVGVTGYRIYRNDTPIDTVSSTFYIDRGLAETTHYVFKVRALDAAGNFADSDPLPVTTVDGTAPSKPTNLRIETDTERSYLFWDMSTDNVKVTGYEVYRNDKLLGTINFTAFFPIDVTEPYWFKVRALDAAGNYADSDLLASKDDQPPSKPGNLRATTITGNSVTLEWAASTDNFWITGYQIFRNNTPITIVNNTHYNATGLTESTTYIFKVRALDAAGNFSDSDPLPVTTPDTTAPSKPTNFRATAITGTAVVLEWAASSDNIGITGYEIYRDNTLIYTVTGTRIEVNGLTAGTTYMFKVRALDAAGNFADSDPLPVTTTKPDTTAPSKPTNFRATGITGTAAVLEWTASSDNVAVILYEIYRGNVRVETATGTRIVITDLTEGTTYTFKVRALDAAGNFADSDPLPVTTKPDTTAPSKPTNFRATTVTETSATLDWDASSDNVAVTGYQILLNSKPLTTVDSTRHVVGGLTGNTTYYFSIRALDAAGNQSETAYVEVTTVGNGPTQLEFNRLSSTAGTIQWKPPIDSVGVTGYQLSIDGQAVREVSQTGFMFTDLSPGTHLFEVRAIRNGQYSDPASISG
ncbi:fibronectin type III domain-containing protein [Pseudomonas fluorescens]|uniref:Fibronectin type-III domain-containing protein n=1 Tax=Pseudomonas fluorescens TaxID=294 RepID=A0A5E7E9V6_PSEFL|nr:fibronectin type III domain-containing protein [Pseudomonas fluorescens]VVO23458.1 hypothetical protein PS691_04369 [Pseudomonas fluorescens]